MSVKENVAFSHIIRDSFTMIFNLFAHLLAIILGWVKLYYSPDDGQSEIKKITGKKN